MLIPFIPLNLKPEKTTVLLGPISRSEREKKKLLSRQKINLKLINIFQKGANKTSFLSNILDRFRFE